MKTEKTGLRNFHVINQLPSSSGSILICARFVASHPVVFA